MTYQYKQTLQFVFLCKCQIKQDFGKLLNKTQYPSGTVCTSIFTFKRVPLFLWKCSDQSKPTYIINGMWMTFAYFRGSHKLIQLVFNEFFLRWRNSPEFCAHYATWAGIGRMFLEIASEEQYALIGIGTLFFDAHI